MRGFTMAAGPGRTVPSTATQYSNFSSALVRAQVLGSVGVHHHLGDAVAVADVEEADAAVVAVPVHPAVQDDRLARVCPRAGRRR